jgi:hypothetical protein
MDELTRGVLYEVAEPLRLISNLTSSTTPVNGSGASKGLNLLAKNSAL